MVLVAEAIRQAAHLGKKPGPTLDGFASVELRNHRDCGSSLVCAWRTGTSDRALRILSKRGVPM